MSSTQEMNNGNKSIERIEFASSYSDVPLSRHAVYLLNQFQLSRLRQGTAAVKNRSKVRGGGAKPFKQKGTGNARRGTNRTPLRPGGGVVFGPTPRSYETSLNSKYVKHAMKVAISLNKEKFSVVNFESGFDRSKDCRSFVNGDRILLVVDVQEVPPLGLLNYDGIEVNIVTDLSVRWMCKADRICVSENAYGRFMELYNG